MIEIRDHTAAMQAAANVAKNRQLEADAAEIRERAERRIGETMAVQPETVGINRGTAGAGNINVTGGYQIPRR